MSLSRKSIRAALLLPTSAVALVLVTACGADTDQTRVDHPSSATTVTSTSVAASNVAQHNSADVMFNQMMIPHHAQAVEMAALVDDRTSTATVRQLAAAIKGAQQPEIDQMTARLTAWGQPVEMPGGHGGHRMTGMMSTEQMAELTAARDAAFDRLWLQMMIRHHEGAVSMANAVLTDGVDQGTRTLATAVKAAQTAEIAQMKALLGVA